MPHGHPLAQATLIASYIVLIVLAADILVGAFPQSLVARAFKQSVT
jgi:hypothetical protein